jgi:TRAP-type mannitol/chloroaromatic compound transport system permease small subunit
MDGAIDWINRLTRFFGQIAGWASFVVVLLICVDVLMRYALGFTLIWVLEVEIYLFSIIFLFGSAYAFQKEKHVRVDILYQKMSTRWQAAIDIIGALFFLLPWCAIIIWVSYNYAYMSWLIGEKSAQPGGLPALYLLKFCLSLGFILLGLQGVSNLLLAVKKWSKPEEWNI